MIAVHYSSKPIESKSIISSRQTHAQSYKLVWEIYKLVADELGLYWPASFGYAYPIEVTRAQFNKDSWHRHVVSASGDQVTHGNLNYSVMITMANNFTDRSIPVLADRIASRNAKIKLQALRYFTWLDNPEKIELISDVWVVQS